jgi:hypothetical protein
MTKVLNFKLNQMTKIFQTPLGLQQSIDYLDNK